MPLDVSHLHCAHSHKMSSSVSSCDSIFVLRWVSSSGRVVHALLNTYTHRHQRWRGGSPLSTSCTHLYTKRTKAYDAPSFGSRSQRTTYASSQVDVLPFDQDVFTQAAKHVHLAHGHRQDSVFVFVLSMTSKGFHGTACVFVQAVRVLVPSYTEQFLLVLTG